jgi:hypothetical protein
VGDVVAVPQGGVVKGQPSMTSRVTMPRCDDAAVRRSVIAFVTDAGQPTSPPVRPPGRRPAENPETDAAMSPTRRRPVLAWTCRIMTTTPRRVRVRGRGRDRWCARSVNHVSHLATAGQALSSRSGARPNMPLLGGARLL